ncbi:hypothetical protein ACA910_011272 [Epithemia clementina (nom. ined.)]
MWSSCLSRSLVNARGSKVVSKEDANHAALPPYAFAPGGRLLSVQVAAEAGLLDNPSNNVVSAIRCRDGVIVVATVPESPYLARNNLTTITTESTTQTTTNNNATTAASTLLPLLMPETGVARPPFLRLSTNMWAATAGNHVDSQLLRLKLHRIAEDIREEDQGDRPDVLARRLADNLQLLTQEFGHGRILAAFAIVFTNTEIWRIDPTGQFWKCGGTVIGRDCFSAESKLLSELMDKDQTGDSSGSSARERIVTLSKDEAIELCRNSISEICPQSPPPPPTTTSSDSSSSLMKCLWLSGPRQHTWFSDSEIREHSKALKNL